MFGRPDTDTAVYVVRESVTSAQIMLSFAAGAAKRSVPTVLRNVTNAKLLSVSRVPRSAVSTRETCEIPIGKGESRMQESGKPRRRGSTRDEETSSDLSNLRFRWFRRRSKVAENAMESEEKPSDDKKKSGRKNQNSRNSAKPSPSASTGFLTKENSNMSPDTSPAKDTQGSSVEKPSKPSPRHTRLPLTPSELESLRKERARDAATTSADAVVTVATSVVGQTNRIGGDTVGGKKVVKKEKKSKKGKKDKKDKKGKKNKKNKKNQKMQMRKKPMKKRQVVVLCPG